MSEHVRCVFFSFFLSTYLSSLLCILEMVVNGILGVSISKGSLYSVIMSQQKRD